jgi:hypothetical protein
MDHDAAYGQHHVDFKCKHREVPPSATRQLIATVPLSQRGQATDFYCFGQMQKDMRHGFILGVISKEHFTEASGTKFTGDRDGNGEWYALDVDYISISEVPKWWNEGIANMFLPFCYREKWIEL